MTTPLNLPVMVLLFVLAACLEEFVPGIPLKAPFICCVPVYYALQREFPLAGFSALAAGIAHDALCGVPVGATSLLILAYAVAAFALRDVILNDSAATASLSGAAVCGLQCLLQRAALGASFEGRGLAWLALATATSAASGAVAAPLFFMLGRRLDRMAMNVKPGKEIDGHESRQSPV